jgi:polysaccharide pyruvyl transferase WcaK-like protein
MKILVHHGAYPNFGDLSMLDTTVDRLAQIEGAELDVRDALLDWRWSNARPVQYKIFPVSLLVDRIVRDSFKRNWSGNILSMASAAWRSMAYRLLSQGWAAGAFPVRVATGWRTLGRWCRPYDGLFVAGGGDMNDSFPEALWRYCALIHVFANAGKPIILSGQQLGPVECPINRRLLLSALKRVSYVGVREPTDSLRFCEEAGLSESQFAMCGDDSLGMAPADIREINELMRAYEITPRGFIAVNLRIAPYSRVSDDALVSFTETLAELSAIHGVDLVVVPVSIDDGDSDVDSGDLLARRIKGPRIKVIRGGRLSGKLIKGLLGHADGVVGVSYHFNTFALSQGVPAVAVYSGDYYRQKAKGLAAFWGDERIAMPVTELDGQAAHRIRAVFEDEGLRQRLKTRAAQATSEWGAIFAANVIQKLEGFGPKSP